MPQVCEQSGGCRLARGCDAFPSQSRCSLPGALVQFAQMSRLVEPLSSCHTGERGCDCEGREDNGPGGQSGDLGPGQPGGCGATCSPSAAPRCGDSEALAGGCLGVVVGAGMGSAVAHLSHGARGGSRGPSPASASPVQLTPSLPSSLLSESWCTKGSRSWLTRDPSTTKPTRVGA